METTKQAQLCLREKILLFFYWIHVFKDSRSTLTSIVALQLKQTNKREMHIGQEKQQQQKCCYIPTHSTINGGRTITL